MKPISLTTLTADRAETCLDCKSGQCGIARGSIDHRTSHLSAESIDLWQHGLHVACQLFKCQNGDSINIHIESHIYIYIVCICMYAVCVCVCDCALVFVYTWLYMYIPHAYSASTNLQNLRQHASAVCQKPAFHLHHLSCKNSHPPLFTMARNANNRGHSPPRPIFTTIQLSFSLGMTDGERLLPPLIFTIFFTA